MEDTTVSSNDWLKENFETRRMALKGLSTAAWVSVIMWLVQAIQTHNFNPTEDVKMVAVTAVSALVAGALVALRNYLKNYWGWDISAWFGVLLVCALLSGCAGMTPALAGKTNLTTTFSDVVTPDGGQNTQYQQTVKAPAGVQLENIASMGYKWNPDGSGDIAIASAPKADTQGQADALVQVNAQQMELIGKMMEQIVALAGIASPLVGGKITADATAQAAAIANKAQLQALVADIVKQALAQQGAAAKNYVQLPK